MKHFKVGDILYIYSIFIIMHSVILVIIIMMIQVVLIMCLRAAVIWGMNEEGEGARARANNGQVIPLCL
jgi:hypothetical protein